MLKNYFKIALRSLLRNKAYSLINIAGLALGMACCISIALYVLHERSYDSFHRKADAIHRVLTIDAALGVSSQLVGITFPALAPAAEAAIPQVKDYVRIYPAGRQLLKREERSVYPESMVYAEPGFFRLFDFPLQAGDPASALDEPNSLVISPKLAGALFGGENPLDQTLNVGNTLVRVSGVLAGTPGPSHLSFDAILSQPEDTNVVNFLQSWNNIAMITYLELESADARPAVNEALETLIRENGAEANFSVTLQSLDEIHLDSPDVLFDGYNTNKSDRGNVELLSIIALFVLIIACVNFTNLSTARSSKRAREVGLRKVAGAVRQQLIGQHLGESVFLSFVAFVGAVIIVELCLPLLNASLGMELVFPLFSRPDMFFVLLTAVVLVGLAAGAYPALVLSRFKPITVLKGSFSSGSRGLMLRRVLVVAQFAVSIGMIAATLIVFSQMRYIHSKNMGFEREQVITINMQSPQEQQAQEALRSTLEQHAAITSTAVSSGLPGRQFGRFGVKPEGQNQDDIWIVSALSFDEDFITTLGMELGAGRNFASEHGTDQQEAVLINEAAARELGWSTTTAVGKSFTLGAGGPNPQTRRVIGVVRDFHFASLRHKIEPLLMFYSPTQNSVLSIKVSPENLDATLDYIEESWARHIPGVPLEYSFFDEEFGRQYRDERNFAYMIAVFTCLAILIACLGLLALASFTSEQRTKEIGVRKVMGASVGTIVFLLSRDFLLLVGIANLIAVPLAFYAMELWLQNFRYRISIGPEAFGLAAVLAIVIALLTIFYQAIRAATANPIWALKYE